MRYGASLGARAPSVADETLPVEILNSGFITHSVADPPPTTESSEKAYSLVERLFAQLVAEVGLLR
jgi:hypothetical protein